MSNVAGQFIASMKSAFFDRAAVLQKIDRDRQKGLVKFGAYVRRRSQTIQRRRKKASKPGEPPSSHAGSNEGLRKILFAYDPVNKRVIIGPVPYGKGVPALHEFGGTARVTEKTPVPSQDFRDASGRFLRGVARTVTTTRTVRFPKRSFMKPALDYVRPKFPQMFNSESTLGSSRGI